MSKMSPKGRSILRLTAVILAMYVLFAVSLYISHKDMSYDISGTEPDVDYMNIHVTGGLAGVKYDNKVYRDGDRFFLEMKDGKDKLELTKTEYLLCTDIDKDYLEQYVEPLASDMFYYEITLGKNGSETVIPRKAYKYTSLGLSEFIYDKRLNEPKGKLVYDTYIDFASYIYSRGIKHSCLVYGTPENKYSYSLQIDKCDISDLGFTEVYSQLRKECAVIMRGSEKPKYKEEKERLLTECRVMDFYGETGYTKDIITENVMASFITCPGTGDYVMFIGARPENISAERINDDIRCIVTGTDAGRNDMYTFIAGTAVFLLLFVIAAAASGTDNVTSGENT